MFIAFFLLRSFFNIFVNTFQHPFPTYETSITFQLLNNP
jgi:hypothetical protein